MVSFISVDRNIPTGFIPVNTFFEFIFRPCPRFEANHKMIYYTRMKIIAVATAFLLTLIPANAHDSWISRGGLKNTAGEWCCGSYDCGVMVSGTVRAIEGGSEVDAVFRITFGGKITDDRIREFWPIRETTPSPDGAYWRCKRPDGTPRCRFVPPPGS